MSLNQTSNEPTDRVEVNGGGVCDPLAKLDRLDAHVVILNNYIRKHHVVAFRALAQRVRKLTILLSVPMEPDRTWDAQWDDLDVRIQKNWMLTTKRNSGFKEPNFIHIPIDTNSQLKSLRPDIVFSYEMGMRTLFSSWYRRFHGNVPLVMVGNMAEHIEQERGLLRRALRWMIKQGVDYCTYNGPSCKRYLERLSIPEDKMFHVPYCIDPAAVYRGEREANQDQTRRLLYCGKLSERKGILQFVRCLNQWCDQNPDRRVEFSFAGSGDLRSKIRASASSNLDIVFLGDCDTQALRQAYGQADICVFPSLGDEWGLVPIEAMASGVPVLGSKFAQSVETVVAEGVNGWVFNPKESSSMLDAIERSAECSPAQLVEMGHAAKKSVAGISGCTTADKFCDVIKSVLPAIKTYDPATDESNRHSE